jgi:hypothetical protein
MEYLEQRVQPAGERAVRFAVPSRDELIEAGFGEQGVGQLLDAPWLSEMVEEIEETPEFCDPDDPPETVLRYARDVVLEYLRKRYELDEL